MLISCGAALFGLRRPSGHWVPAGDGTAADPARLRLMARVSTGAATPMNSLERRMLDAVPHRHTHRGPFAPGPLPHGLLAGLQHDALAEGATLTLVTGGLAYGRLEQIAAAAARRQGADPRTRAEIRRWTRIAADTARDGIPVTALASSTGRPAGRLPQRDFDLGRDITRLPSGGAPPAATAVLLTSGDRRADWLRAGQALYRLLLHAASQGVSASLYTQPLESGNPQPDQPPARAAGPSPDAASARSRNHRVPDRPTAARRTRQPLTPPTRPLWRWPGPARRRRSAGPSCGW